MTAPPLLVYALWLGILTSISPCPLATNVAALSFISRRFDKPLSALISGVSYTLGRVVAYTVLGAFIVGGILSIPDVSFYLQMYLNKFMGPILVLVGMFLLDLIKIRLPGISVFDKLGQRATRWGHPGALFLGFLFALSFCPVSAALFFGGLIPAALDGKSSIAMPAIFGVGTGLPVLAVAIPIALGARKMANIFRNLSLFEIWARRITGIVFILIGIYYILTHIFEVW